MQPSPISGIMHAPALGWRRPVPDVHQQLSRLSTRGFKGSGRSVPFENCWSRCWFHPVSQSVTGASDVEVPRREPPTTLCVSHLALEKPWYAWLRSRLELSASQVLCQAELQPLAEREFIKTPLLMNLARTQFSGRRPRVSPGRSTRASACRRRESQRPRNRAEPTVHGQRPPCGWVAYR